MIHSHNPDYFKITVNVFNNVMICEQCISKEFGFCLGKHCVWRLHDLNNLLNWTPLKLMCSKRDRVFIGPEITTFSIFLTPSLSTAIDTLSCWEFGSNWYNNHKTLCDDEYIFDSFSFFSHFCSDVEGMFNRFYSHSTLQMVMVNCCTSTCYAPLRLDIDLFLEFLQSQNFALKTIKMQ